MDREQRSNHCHSPPKPPSAFPSSTSNPVPSQPPHCNGGFAAIGRWTLKVLCVAFCEAHGVAGQEEEKASGQILPCHPLSWLGLSSPKGERCPHQQWHTQGVNRKPSIKGQGCLLKVRLGSGEKGPSLRPLMRWCADPRPLKSPLG